MEPDSITQIRWGLGACLIALLAVLVLALVPDPLFRQHVYVTQLDDVAGIKPGADIGFRGATVGSVRSVELDPDSGQFDVVMGISRRWRPSPCSQIQVSAANPLTAPGINLVTQPAKSGSDCALARQAIGCDPLAPPAAGHARVLVGCKRQPDLLQAAAHAVEETARVAQTANEMAGQLKLMLQGDGAGGAASGVGMAAIARNATATLAAINSLSSRLDRNFEPGRGDIAITLGNVRRLSGRAANLDVAQANAILLETRNLIAQNQASVAELLKRSAGSAGELQATLEGASASLIEASANLDRISGNLGQLSERLAADPTYAIRGQTYFDPPPPGDGK